MAIAVGGRISGRKVRKARAVRPSKKIEKAVRTQLEAQLSLLFDEVQDRLRLRGLLQSPEVALVNRAIQELQERWREIYGSMSNGFAGKWIAAISKENKEAFHKSMRTALGVEFVSVFDDERIKEVAEVAAFEASSLIKTIPEEFFEQITRAVLHNYQQLPFPEDRTLWEEIQHIYGVTKNRAVIIARDQTSKVNTALTRARCEAAGIEEYIWRTAGDQRVVGNPVGLYPKWNIVHGNHYERNGQTYKWNEPPFDGHAGFSINCRCVAEPIINVDKLKFM